RHEGVEQPRRLQIVDEERKLPQRRHRRLVGPFDPHRPLEAVDLDPGRKLRLDNQRLFTRRVRRKGAGIARHAPQNARFSTSRETETAVSRFSHLARFLAPWRSCEPSSDGDEQVRAEQEEPAPVRVRTLDPMTGRAISPLTAAALCVKPRGQMTARQVANVDALKAASAEFTAMRHLAMRFRGLLRGGTPEGLDAWLIDARASGIYAMQRFARTIRQDLEAVRNAASEPWSNGQTEGQINRLKTLKRAMYGRAG